MYDLVSLSRPFATVSAFALLVVGALGLGLGPSTTAEAMETALKEIELGPLGDSKTLHLSGEIVEGDADRISTVLRGLDFSDPSGRLHVVLNSPGGSLIEGMRIGRLLDGLPTTVTISVGVDAEPIDAPGLCASACALVYLGGHYRYLQESSLLGVHQFAFGGDESMSGANAAAVSQLLSAEVSDYVREMRVDPEFFSLMSRTYPEDVHWIDRKTLERLRVVTNGIYDQSSEYKNANGVFYLLLWQQSYYGENKIVAACSNSQMWFQAYLQPPSLDIVARMPHELFVIIDEEEIAPAYRQVPEAGERFASAAFSLSPDQLLRLSGARSVGARMMVPNAGVFFGFEMDLPDTKLRDTILGCANVAQ